MNTRKKLLVALSATLLILLVAAGAIGIGSSRAAAATPNTGTPTTKTSSKATLCSDFQAKLAANLNVSQDQLLAALKKTALDEVNAAQQAGKLNATQARKITARINQSTGASLCRLVAGWRGERGKMARFQELRGALGSAAAQYFGISEQQFVQDLRTTGTLQGVAAKYGKDNAQGKAGLEQALENALRQTLASKNVPQTRIDQVAQLFKQHFDQLYTHQFKGGQPGRAPSKSATPSS